MVRSSLFVGLMLQTLLAGAQRLPADKNALSSKADSLVTCFFGTNTFHRYIVADRKDAADTVPDRFFFRYTLNRPEFHRKKFIISFSLTPRGQLIVDKTMQGLVHAAAFEDSTWITRREALRHCKREAYRIKKNSLRLIWDATDVSYDLYQKTHRIRDISGDVVWEVKGKVKFRGDIYKGKFHVNALTGVVSRRFPIPWD